MAARGLSRLLPSLVVFAALLAAWQAAGPLFGVREYLLPGPLAVARALTSFFVPWHRHLWVTTLEILGGFALAGAAGVALGIAVAWSPLAARALLPFLVFVNTLPKVAVAPLFLLWLGYGILPNVLIAALIGFFPVVINTAVGLTQVDEELLDLGRVFGAPTWKVFLTIRLPNALRATRSRASSHVARRQGPPRVARSIGWSRRLGLSRISGAAWPRTQRKPRLSGLSGSPVTRVTRPSSTSTSIPHSVGWQFIGHIVRTVRVTTP